MKHQSRIFKTSRFCEICGAQACDIHHVFGGTARQISDKYGATVFICRKCHDDIHRHPLKYEWLKQETQKKVMESHNWDLDDWFNVFHKNYL